MRIFLRLLLGVALVTMLTSPALAAETPSLSKTVFYVH